MKYNPPYGSTDPDASYVQGDEGAGILGSLTPKEAFEHPQREIVHVIEEAGLTPSASNLTQLYTAITTIVTNAIAAATLAVASVAEILAGTAQKVVRVDRLWGAGAFVTLTDASTIALDLSAGINFSVTLGGNRTLANPTNAKAGQSGAIKVTQDGTGGRTLSFGSSYKFFDGLVPDLKTTAGAVNRLSYLVLDDGTVEITYVRGLA